MCYKHSELVQSIKDHCIIEMRSRDQSIQDITNQTRQQSSDHKLELERKLQVGRLYLSWIHVDLHVHGVHVQYNL